MCSSCDAWHKKNIFSTFNFFNLKLELFFPMSSHLNLCQTVSCLIQNKGFYFILCIAYLTFPNEQVKWLKIYEENKNGFIKNFGGKNLVKMKTKEKTHPLKWWQFCIVQWILNIIHILSPNANKANIKHFSKLNHPSSTMHPTTVKWAHFVE